MDRELSAELTEYSRSVPRVIVHTIDRRNGRIYFRQATPIPGLPKESYYKLPTEEFKMWCGIKDEATIEVNNNYMCNPDFIPAIEKGLIKLVRTETLIAETIKKEQSSKVIHML